MVYRILKKKQKQKKEFFFWRFEMGLVTFLKSTFYVKEEPSKSVLHAAFECGRAPPCLRSCLPDRLRLSWFDLILAELPGRSSHHWRDWTPFTQSDLTRTIAATNSYTARSY